MSRVADRTTNGVHATPSAAASVVETTRPVAAVQGVSFGYPPFGLASPVLDDVTLEVEPLDFLGVIGPNGGGKTTLLKVLLGFITPQSGTVQVFGRRPTEVRQRIGYVPQHSSVDASVPANVLDIVLMGRLARSRWGIAYGRRDIDQALDALARTGVADLARRRFGELSGGQRQRVLIARALAGDAELLLLDEPTAGVDAHAGQGLTDLLHELNDRLPIVIVSHDISFVSTHLKRVACLNRKATCHRATDITHDVIERMYHGHGAVRVIEHDVACPLNDPGCGHGCQHGCDEHATEDDTKTSAPAGSVGVGAADATRGGHPSERAGAGRGEGVDA